MNEWMLQIDRIARGSPVHGPLRVVLQISHRIQIWARTKTSAIVFFVDLDYCAERLTFFFSFSCLTEAGSAETPSWLQSQLKRSSSKAWCSRHHASPRVWPSSDDNRYFVPTPPKVSFSITPQKIPYFLFLWKGASIYPPQLCEELKRSLPSAGSEQYLPDIPAAPSILP